MFCFNRSQDTFLGVPYNIASSSLLLMVVAKITGKTPRFMKMSMGDTHLYENHLQQASLQCTRIPYKFPTITLPEISSLNDIENYTATDFVLQNYLSHPKIQADMVV
jgi:thymidylate synthase